MELTYADSNGIELGQILDFDMDTAIGKDENTFSVIIPLADHCCLEDYRIYIDGTEMGGIIDTIIPNTEDNTVTYEGRTWHGIIEKKIIEPLANQDYYSTQGEANEVLTELINYLGLSSLYTVSTDISTITIQYYQFDRYINGFTGICKMLYANNGKLVVEYSNKMVNLSVIPLYDYSESEEFDSSQIDFAIERNYNHTNHLICLGRGELKNRKVIHLFTDENGGVQAYANVSIPYNDSHYILDKSSQLLFNQAEITDVLDYPNAEIVYNYVLLTEKPENWDNWQLDTSFIKYYTQDTSGESFTQNKLEYQDNYYVLTAQPADWLYDYSDYYYLDGTEYKSINGVEGVSYVLQTSQPSDWTDNYLSYYYLDGAEYKSVASVEMSNYSILANRPSDWDSTYANYYYYFFDGVEWSYRSAQGTSQTKYNLQTGQPSDWNTNYSSYYSRVAVKKYKYKVKTKINKKWVVSYEYYDTKISNTKTSTLIRTYQKRVTHHYDYNSVQLVNNKVPKWAAKKYYTSESYTAPLVFVANYYYLRTSYTVNPTWQSGTYYTKNIGETAPTFSGGTYYKKLNEPIILEFVNNTYYEKFEDNYYTLVQKGIETLQKSYDCDTIDIKLDTDYEYDINDIIGAREEITGISIFQPIVKKIYKVTNNIEPTITYEIGVW